MRMSLNGVEVAAKLTGKGSLKLAGVLIKELNSNKHSKGKQRMRSMLKSGSALKVYPVRDEELAKFAREAKKYAVPYCVLKDRDKDDGITEIMVRADDDSKVNRIFERNKLSTVPEATIQTEIERKRATDAEKAVPDKSQDRPKKMENFLEELMKKPAPNSEKAAPQNPTHGRTTKSGRSVPSSASSMTDKARSFNGEDPRKRPSVRKELKEISRELDKKYASRSRNKTQEIVHKEPKKKTKKKER